MVIYIHFIKLLIIDAKQISNIFYTKNTTWQHLNLFDCYNFTILKDYMKGHIFRDENKNGVISL